MPTSCAVNELNLARAMKARDALEGYEIRERFEQKSLVEALRDIRHYCRLGCLQFRWAVEESRSACVGDLK